MTSCKIVNVDEFPNFQTFGNAPTSAHFVKYSTLNDSNSNASTGRVND